MSIKERIKHTTQLIALNEAMIKAARERLTQTEYNGQVIKQILEQIS